MKVCPECGGIMQTYKPFSGACLECGFSSAYAITNIEDGPSVFHCRHEVEFIDLLREHQYRTVLCFDDDGQIEINRGAIEEIKATIKTREVSKETKKIIAEIEKLFDESGKDFIVVDCF